MSKLTQALKEIISWLRLNYPEAVCNLRQGLNLQQIEEVTKDFPFVLPREVTELYQFCDGNMRLGNYDLIMYPLELALEASNSWEWAKKTPSLDSHILTIFHGDGHDVYYVICDKQKKDFSPVWSAWAAHGCDASIYASSLTNLILTVAECYREGSYYTQFDEEGDLEIGTNLETFEKIFQKYNPKQIDAWREIWKD